MRGADVDVRQGAGVVAVGEVLERRLDERAVLAVEAAFAWIDVSSTAGLVMRALLSRAAYLSANNCRRRQLERARRMVHGGGYALRDGRDEGSKDGVLLSVGENFVALNELGLHWRSAVELSILSLGHLQFRRRS